AAAARSRMHLRAQPGPGIRVRVVDVGVLVAPFSAEQDGDLVFRVPRGTAEGAHDRGRQGPQVTPGVRGQVLTPQRVVAPVELAHPRPAVVAGARQAPSGNPPSTGPAVCRLSGPAGGWARTSATSARRRAFCSGSLPPADAPAGQTCRPGVSERVSR